QAGTTEGNDCTSVAVTPDGPALLVGWTDDDFLADATNYFTDFAGVMIETGGESSAGSTTFTPAPGASPSLTPAPFEAPSTPPETPAPESSPPQPSAGTPQPVASSPSSCGATESFQITSDGLREIEGCFQA
ncbi:unnamed protein product, partial [Pylaiella littoralis]